jgi:hypothetical protein
VQVLKGVKTADFPSVWGVIEDVGDICIEGTGRPLELVQVEQDVRGVSFVDLVD